MTHHETLLAIRNNAVFAAETIGAMLAALKGTPHAVSSAAGQAEEARRRITANVALLAEKPDVVSPLVDVARRMRWLCSELHGGNAFSKADLWRWQEDANAALSPVDGTAPDMLEALRWIGALIEGGEAMPKPTDDVAVSIFSVIAKAEGRASADSYESAARAAGWQCDEAGIFHTARGGANGTGDPVEYADDWKEACEISGIATKAEGR